MAKKIDTPIELNEALTNFITDILKVGASSRSDVFDETVRTKLLKHLTGAKYVPTESWGSKNKNSIYAEYYRRTLKKDFNFTDLPDIVDNGEHLNLLIVDKPNGSQQWPDLLVVFNKVGFPIEVKSNRNDLILWNSGLPRDNGLYIFNCYGKSKTTCFLGQHAIKSNTRKSLIEFAKLASELNNTVEDWSFYVRKMFNNSTRSYFENDDLVTKSKILQKKIDNNNNLLHELGTEGHKGTIRKLGRENIEHAEEAQKFDNEYKSKQMDRLFIEKSTLDFIKSLTWDENQTLNFHLGSDDEDEIIEPTTIKSNKPKI
ncbi:hypothetical protein [Burkholderia cenocepacia]|uniref:hypothetical protein n=2 Tax=Burkholderia cenocepacia TaxID=95486 RepID=UPI0022373662|nr:hypothetical protein [Burkholderia cenocepacia]MCW5156303.1 hypothetical protein [Burkholderia cenocepacia]